MWNDNSVLNHLSATKKEIIKLLNSPHDNNGQMILASQINDTAKLIDERLDKCKTDLFYEACFTFYDFCEITNSWVRWERWASSERCKKTRPLIYAGLGRSHEEKGRLKKAIEYHKIGLELDDNESNQKWKAMNHLGLGIVQSRLFETKAKKNLFQALRLFRKSKDKYYLGFTHSNLGGFYYRELLKRLNVPKSERPFHSIMLTTIKSIYHHVCSIQIHKNKKYLWDLPIFYYSLGWTLFLSKLFFPMSKNVFEKSIHLASSSSQLRYIALGKYGLAWFFYMKKEYNRAAILSKEAYDDYRSFYYEFDKIGYYGTSYYRENEYNILYLRCKIFHKLDQYENLSERFKKLFDLITEDSQNSLQIPSELINNMINLAIEANLCLYLEPLCRLQMVS